MGGRGSYDSVTITSRRSRIYTIPKSDYGSIECRNPRLLIYYVDSQVYPNSEAPILIGRRHFAASDYLRYAVPIMDVKASY